VSLVGAGGLLNQPTRNVVETALEAAEKVAGELAEWSARPFEPLCRCCSLTRVVKSVTGRCATTRSVSSWGVITNTKVGWVRLRWLV
jgi:hypothetical protein